MAVKAQEYKSRLLGLSKDEGGNDVKEKNELYDMICRVLTDYEEGNANAEDLYDVLVEVQNRWEDVITAQDE